MVKNHIKTIAAPRTWPVRRKKATKYILRPSPGTHSLDRGMPLALVLVSLGLGKTKREITHLLHTTDVLVDGVRRKENKFIVGLFDVICVPSLGKQWRMLLDAHGELKLLAISAEESAIKPLKILNKSLYKGKIQLNCSDGRNLLTQDTQYKVGDTVIYDLGKKTLAQHLPLAKGSVIFLVGGKSLGKLGTVEDVLGRVIVYKVGDEVNQTKRRYAFVIGEKKALISVEA
ncbi:MAG: S4 domain-containing protein [Nanoarchaeota archaeon]|nr:S4 domain-containing protein [Nanoarchaeota archaeon]